MLLDFFAEALSRRADFEGVGVVRNPDALGLWLRQDPPDVLVCSVSVNEGGVVAALCRDCPRLAVVSLSAAGDGAVLHSARQGERVLADLSVDELLDAARWSCSGGASGGGVVASGV